MDHKQEKLENPARLAELNPEATLKKIGIGKQDVVCDIGAGSGIFAIAAATITQNTVWALDINEELLRIIREKAERVKLANVKTSKVNGFEYGIAAGSVDIVLLVTVLHEIGEKGALLAEIKRILKKTGKLAVIEFHKAATPLGPPEAHRIAREEVFAACGESGFTSTDSFDLGDNFYCVVLRVAG